MIYYIFGLLGDFSFFLFPSSISFNGHLGEKGISGSIKISYEEKTLKVEVHNLFWNPCVICIF